MKMTRRDVTMDLELFFFLLVQPMQQSQLVFNENRLLPWGLVQACINHRNQVTSYSRRVLSGVLHKPILFAEKNEKRSTSTPTNSFNKILYTNIICIFQYD